MKIYQMISFSIFLIGMMACTNNQKSSNNMQTVNFIPDASTENVIAHLKDSLGEDHAFRMERGVRQVAALWREQDGSADDFAQFCLTSFVADTAALFTLFSTLEAQLRGDQRLLP